jgi:hypothetical protein
MTRLAGISAGGSFMSSYADSSAATVWIDGDAFRGAANGAEPPDPFASAPTSGGTAMAAFGGIKAGFKVTPDTDVTDYDVWNNESGATFLQVEGKTKVTITFRVSQLSKAAFLTYLRGGSVAETSTGNGIWKHTVGSGEEFSLLLQLRGSDGVKKAARWIPRCKLSKRLEDVLDDSDLAGWDIEIEVLAPTSGQAVVPFTNWNPLA